MKIMILAVYLKCFWIVDVAISFQLSKFSCASLKPQVLQWLHQSSSRLFRISIGKAQNMCTHKCFYKVIYVGQQLGLGQDFLFPSVPFLLVTEL